jgi:hypothetical protein
MCWIVSLQISTADTSLVLKSLEISAAVNAQSSAIQYPPCLLKLYLKFKKIRNSFLN